MPKLYAFREDRLGFSFEIGQKAILGRAPECDLILFDRSASRHHAEIFNIDDKYYLADLGSTNGTLLNDQPVTLQTRLEPFDSIKIGRELFIFEPHINIIIGPAPSAIIIEDLSEEVHNLVAMSAREAAGRASAEDLPSITALAYRLCQAEDSTSIENVIKECLQERFGMTFMSLLWPTLPPARRLVSFMTSHEDKRMLLSHAPYIRALRDRQVLLWPHSISELSFHEGNRQVTHSDFPALVGPLFGVNGATGLLYLENQNKAFTEEDLAAFAALLPVLSPAILRMVDRRGRESMHGLYNSGAREVPMIHTDDQVKIVFSTAAQAAAGKGSILISGETGTGKAALAEYIHNISPRKIGRLITASLASIQPGDIERAIFGQAAGHGDDHGHVGLMELADGGTLFLQHVEYLPAPTQRSLLMAIEEGMFFPLHSGRPKAVDLRVVSSTSVDLWSRVEGGFFREDLYLRLSGINISMPPLRDIKDDLEHILLTHMHKASRALGIPFTGLDPAVLECLRAYRWPGNMAELRQEAALMVLFSRNGRVTLEDLPDYLRMAASSQTIDDDEHVPPIVREAERFQMIRAMARCGGDLEAVAAVLGRRPEDVILKMRSFGIDPIDYQAPVITSQPKSPSQTALPTS
ncbi:hypothetical protein C4J81_05895 [Deltaproteobacteria bacterium Smac51]|nr:hypothetical protein C4J81_05895 [Deltaproteobacteria bacterium Smac51]